MFNYLLFFRAASEKLTLVLLHLHHSGINLWCEERQQQVKMVDGQCICHNIPTLNINFKIYNLWNCKNVTGLCNLIKILSQKPTCARTILAPKQRIRMTVEIQRAAVWVEERSNHSWYVWKMTYYLNPFPNKTLVVMPLHISHEPKLVCLIIKGIAAGLSFQYIGQQTWPSLLKKVTTTLGFCRRTSSPASSIIFYLTSSLTISLDFQDFTTC